MKLNRTSIKKRGAALVEYGLLIAGVALICAAAVSLFGHKTNDLVGTVAGVLPSSGDNAEDIGAINSGKLIQTTVEDGGITIDWTHHNSSGNNTDASFGSGATGIINDTSQ